MGTDVKALPRPATMPASSSAPAPTPASAEGQWRVCPTAITIVSASTASTAQAKKTEIASPSSAPVIR
jgi:hypothetical protein